MDNDLISREALKEKWKEECCGCCENCSHCMTGLNCELIYNAPTVITCEVCKNKGNERECVDCHDYSCFVQYEPRPHGKWIIQDIVHCLQYCSECRTYSEFKWNFCPNCGADMREDSDET